MSIFNISFIDPLASLLATDIFICSHQLNPLFFFSFVNLKLNVVVFNNFDAVIVLNDVNYFLARKYWKKGIKTVLHLDGAEAKRSGLPFIGKFAHWFFRRLAVKSGIPLVVDSGN